MSVADKDVGEENGEMIEVISSDNVSYLLDEPVASMFLYIDHIIYQRREFGDVKNNGVKKYEVGSISLPDGVTSQLFEKMLAWAKYHHDDPDVDLIDVEEDYDKEFDSCELGSWDSAFVAPFDRSFVFQLMNAVGKVELNGLQRVLAKTIANWIRGQSVEKIREMLNIENDFSPDEEDLIRLETDLFLAKIERNMIEFKEVYDDQ